MFDTLIVLYIPERIFEGVDLEKKSADDKKKHAKLKKIISRRLLGIFAFFFVDC